MCWIIHCEGAVGRIVVPGTAANPCMNLRCACCRSIWAPCTSGAQCAAFVATQAHGLLLVACWCSPPLAIWCLLAPLEPCNSTTPSGAACAQCNSTLGAAGGNLWSHLNLNRNALTPCRDVQVDRLQLATTSTAHAQPAPARDTARSAHSTNFVFSKDARVS